MIRKYYYKVGLEGMMIVFGSIEEQIFHVLV